MTRTANDARVAHSSKLAGKIAIVTGAGSGIGRETALLFAREGAAVFGVDRNADGIQAVAREAKDAGLVLAAHAVDLQDPTAAAAVFAECQRALGRPSILANIAGVASDRSIHLSTDEDFNRYIDVNLGITFRMSREAVRVFGDDGSAIVNTTSAVAMVGMRGTAPYSAAKAAVIGLTRQMAADYGPRYIRVNAVAPGLIRTPATAARVDQNAFDDNVTKARPLPRVGTPLDIARAFAFLASEEASFITGVVLPVCGGWTTTRFRA